MKHVFILGAPFSGSTLLTAFLNSHPNVFAIGELERLPKFRRFEHLVANDPTIYSNECLVCKAKSIECPIWHRETLDRIDSISDVLEIHHFLAQLSSERLTREIQYVVDSSKTPDWLRFAARSHAGGDKGFQALAGVQACAIITTKSPFGYAESALRRDPIHPIFAGQAWCDIMTDALRVISALSIPSIVVRHEALQADPTSMLRRVSDFLNLSTSDSTLADMMTKRSQAHHSIGGNTFAYSDVLDQFGAVELPKGWEGLRKHYESNGGNQGSHSRRWLRTLSRQEVVGVASARGVQDLAQQFGYDLSVELEMYFETKRLESAS